MQAILAGSQIDRPHGYAVHDGADLVERQPVDARGVAIAEGAREIALVGQAQAERECDRIGLSQPIVRCDRH